MEPPISPLLYAGLLFIGMQVLLEIGRRQGIKRRPQESEGERGSLHHRRVRFSLCSAC